MLPAKDLPIFWSFRRCPYAMRARLALRSSGQQVQLREILLRDKPAAFLQTSPKGTVPVLDLRQCQKHAQYQHQTMDMGLVIEESRQIMTWALSLHDPQGWLNIYHQDQPRVEAFFERLDGSFKAHLDHYKYASRYGEDALIHRQQGGLFLAKMNDSLAVNGALSGQNPGLLDYASLPFVRQFRSADQTWFDAQDWPHLHRWLGAFLNGALFADVMQKFPLWEMHAATDNAAPLIFPSYD